MLRRSTISLLALSSLLTPWTPIGYGQQVDAPPTDRKGPPLPFHTIEGYGGGAITPIAYLVNPAPKDQLLGLPSVAFSYVNLGSKNLQAFTISETIGQRLELSYGADRLDLGSLPSDIQSATGVDVQRSDVWLHTVSGRLLVLEENSFDQAYLPAITLGVHGKFNDGIGHINDRLSGALNTIGYDQSAGVEFTQTASKTFTQLFNRPLILTAGLRESQTAQIGFLGFGEEYKVTFEGNIVFLPTDWLLIAYEFRQKANPYSNGLDPLIGPENDWHAIDVSWLINKHATLVAGVGNFGRLTNSRSDLPFWVQFKYEF